MSPTDSVSILELNTLSLECSNINASPMLVVQLDPQLSRAAGSSGHTSDLVLSSSELQTWSESNRIILLFNIRSSLGSPVWQRYFADFNSK